MANETPSPPPPPPPPPPEREPDPIYTHQIAGGRRYGKGYAKGGDVGGDMPKSSDFDKGVSPSKYNATAGSRSDALDAAQRELSEGAQRRYAKGGAVTGKAPWRKWGW